MPVVFALMSRHISTSPLLDLGHSLAGSGLMRSKQGLHVVPSLKDMLIARYFPAQVLHRLQRRSDCRIINSMSARTSFVVRSVPRMLGPGHICDRLIGGCRDTT